MKILVTGGNGFIGSHIVKELSTRGFDVISFDIMQPKERLPGVNYIESTVMDLYSLALSMKGCDGVFHLAAILGVKRADKDLLKCMNINIQGTVNVLAACVMSDIPYILLTSSSEVFGDINTNEVTENSALNPKSGYAVSKLASEYYIKGHFKEFGLGYNIVRLFNVYGWKTGAVFLPY